LTPAETTNETPSATTETVEAQHDHASHDHQHDLEPGLHTHTHQHGPSLNPECTREIVVEAPVEDVDKAFRSVIKRYQKLARIPGFRAGKVPESLVKSKFIREIRQEVLEGLVSERFRQTIEQQGLHPISQPQVAEMNLFEGQPLRFKAAFEVLPSFDITGYDAIKIEKPDTALADDEFEGELARVLDSHSTVEPVADERPLTDGDWAEISFKGEIKDLAQTVTEEGLKDASKPEPISGDDVLIEVGGKNTLPAFNDALRGAKPGAELDFEVDYPADFGERRLAGKTVHYDVTIKSIKRKIKPELNEELAKQLGDYESWDDFLTKFREHLGAGKKSRLENIAQEKLIEELIAKYSFPVPESLVQQQVDARLERGLRALAQQGMTSEAMRQLDFTRLRAAQRDSAVNEVKASLILDKIAQVEKIEVPQEEFDRELLMLSLQAREPLEQLRERLTQDGSLNRIREQLLREKTGKLLYEKATA